MWILIVAEIANFNLHEVCSDKIQSQSHYRHAYSNPCDGIVPVVVSESQVNEFIETDKDHYLYYEGEDTGQNSGCYERHGGSARAEAPIVE